MDTTNITIEETGSLNQGSSTISKIYIANDFLLFVFFFIFIGFTSHVFNMAKLLTFNEQLALINKPNFSNALLMLVGLFAAFDVIRAIFNTAIEEEPLLSKFSSIWTPIRLVIITSFFMPFAHNGIMTSTVTENIKWIIKFLAN
jgi:hypothetical protein